MALSINELQGQEFLVTQEIQDYAKERDWGTGYVKYWLVGQTAYIGDQYNGIDGKFLRCKIDSPKPGSLSCGLPIGLVVDAMMIQGI